MRPLCRSRFGRREWPAVRGGRDFAPPDIRPGSPCSPFGADAGRARRFTARAL